MSAMAFALHHKRTASGDVDRTPKLRRTSRLRIPSGEAIRKLEITARPKASVTVWEKFISANPSTPLSDAEIMSLFQHDRAEAAVVLAAAELFHMDRKNVGSGRVLKAVRDALQKQPFDNMNGYPIYRAVDFKTAKHLIDNFPELILKHNFKGLDERHLIHIKGSKVDKRRPLASGSMRGWVWLDDEPTPSTRNTDSPSQTFAPQTSSPQVSSNQISSPQTTKPQIQSYLLRLRIIANLSPSSALSSTDSRLSTLKTSTASMRQRIALDLADRRDSVPRAAINAASINAASINRRRSTGTSRTGNDDRATPVRASNSHTLPSAGATDVKTFLVSSDTGVGALCDAGAQGSVLGRVTEDTALSKPDEEIPHNDLTGENVLDQPAGQTVLESVQETTGNNSADESLFEDFIDLMPISKWTWPRD